MDNAMMRLMALLKIRTEDMLLLHHLVNGDGFFEAHPLLGEWYDILGKDTDTVCESGLRMGLNEPTIKDAVLMYDSLPAVDRGKLESYTEAKRIMDEVCDAMQAAEAGAPADIVNKLQEMEYDLRQEADYKAARALK